jgi:hypothetical protein
MRGGTLVRLSASWGVGGEVVVDLVVSTRNWSTIIRGDKITIRGKGYHYDGEFFRDFWDFFGGLDGKLIIRCGTPESGDYSAQGFVGTPRQVMIRPLA